MTTEIERKYLVNTNAWAPAGPGVRLTQGYLTADKAGVVRVRIEGRAGTLTIKGPTRGITRGEFEYAIPVSDAEEMLASMCRQPLIDKHRHTELHGDRVWQIDVFHGANHGLVVAEVELADEDAMLQVPAWAEKEVSSDPRYFNSNLLTHPYREWQ